MTTRAVQIDQATVWEHQWEVDSAVEEAEDGVDTDPTHVALIMELTTGMIAGITKTAQIIDQNEEQVVAAEVVNHMEEEAEALEEETSTTVVEPTINKIIKITTVDRCSNHKNSIMQNRIKF